MFPSICILGRQPALGLAELESLYGAEAVKPIGNVAAWLNVQPQEVSFDFLGGTMKFCKLLTVLDTTRWVEIQRFLVGAVPQHAKKLPSGKMRLGLSVYGLDVEPRQITGAGLELKKVLKKSDRSARVVPNSSTTLNSAQVLHNQLTGPVGWELVIIREANKTIIAQSIAVQDITAYTKRDRERPKRDARVGMLPPKLAQIIINLASAEAQDPSCVPGKTNGKTVLDCFCGTGTLLMESALMGYKVYGTDIEPRLIDYSKENLDWLSQNIGSNLSFNLEVADATNYIWKNEFDFVASEAYLGRPFTSPPSNEMLQQTITEVNIISKKFLLNITSQTKSGFRLCLALPAWKTSNGFKRLPLLDKLEELGYNRVSFVHAAGDELIYYREGQIVGRELITLIRK